MNHLQYTTNPTERHRACLPSNPAERGERPSSARQASHRAIFGVSSFFVGFRPPWVKLGIPQKCSVGARQKLLGGMLGERSVGCSVGAHRALGRIARRACSVALGGISGVPDAGVEKKEMFTWMNGLPTVQVFLGDMLLFEHVITKIPHRPIGLGSQMSSKIKWDLIKMIFWEDHNSLYFCKVDYDCYMSVQ